MTKASGTSAGDKRRARRIGFLAGAALLLMGSAAFACVTFRGQMTLTGDTPGNPVTGDETTHGYCTTGQPLVAARANNGDTIKVDVAAAVVCATATNKLAAGTWDVNIRNDAAYTLIQPSPTSPNPNSSNVVPSFVNGMGCSNFFSSYSDFGNLGSMTIDATGAGTWSGTLIAPTLNGALTDSSAICVVPQGAATTFTNLDGIFAPLTVL